MQQKVERQQKETKWERDTQDDKLERWPIKQILEAG